MTRREMSKLLKTPLCERQATGGQVLDWESDDKAFIPIRNNLAMDQFLYEDVCILKCKASSGTYFFGVGLEECDNMPFKKVLELFRSGKWYIYS